MHLIVDIDLDNAAFSDGAGNYDRGEIADTLRRLADRIENDVGWEARIFDVNGNTVGEWQMGAHEDGY